MSGRILSPCSFLLRRIVWHGLLVDILPHVEIKELGIGENGQILFQIIGAVMLVHHIIMARWDGVQVGNILRNVRTPPTTIEARHGPVSGTGITKGGGNQEV